jgi:hypothetical protein
MAFVPIVFTGLFSGRGRLFAGNAPRLKRGSWYKMAPAQGFGMGTTSQDSDDDGPGIGEAEWVLPIDGTLDLHTFSPREIKELIPDYITECLARGICELRIVHGKGRGVLRRSVHALLSRDSRVASFRLADEGGGGWGATLVQLQQT